MIRHLRNPEIDKVAWDAHLARCAGPVWYARSAVLDATCPGWEALWDEEHGAVMPLTGHRKWGLIPYLYQPFPLQQLGVFAVAADARLAGEVLRAVPARFRLVDIHVNNATVEGAGKDWRFTPRQDHLVPLDRSIGDVRAAYSTNHVRSLKRAVSAGLVLDRSMGADAFLELLTGAPQWRDWRVGARQAGGLVRLVHMLLRQSEGECVAVLQGGNTVAAACFVHHGDRTIFLKGLSLPAARPLNAMHLLIDHMLEDRAGRMRWLDLAGGNDPSLARFYAGFGAVPALYLHATRQRFPVRIRHQ